jgi:hypothetical protein
VQCERPADDAPEMDDKCIDFPKGLGPNQPNYDENGKRICKSFGNCINGHYITTDCPEGEYFDRVIKLCYTTSSLPCGTDCSPSCETETTTLMTTATETTLTTVPIDSKCIETPNADRPYYQAWGPSCTRFVSCRNGVYHLETCLDNYYFDIVSNACYKISSLPCGARCSPPCSTTTTSISTTTEKWVDYRCAATPTGLRKGCS